MLKCLGHLKWDLDLKKLNVKTLIVSWKNLQMNAISLQSTMVTGHQEKKQVKQQTIIFKPTWKGIKEKLKVLLQISPERASCELLSKVPKVS